MRISFRNAFLVACVLLPSGPSEALQRSSRARPPIAELQKKDEINGGILGLAAGQLEGAPIRLASEIARAVDDGNRLHVLPIVTRGPAENIESLLYLRGVDLAIINTDALEQFKTKVPNLRDRITYILNLFPSEVHVLARPGIEKLEDLKGKKVNFNTAGTAAAYSGPLLFDTLGLDIEKVFIPHPAALEQMQTGDIDAVFFVTSKPVDAFLKRKYPPGFNLLDIPYDERVADYYLPATLVHDDYPNLIREGQEVQTIAAQTALIAFNWPAKSERYLRLQRFVTELFDNIEKLQRPGNDPKWASISIGASVSSLNRFRAAQEWIDRQSQPATRVVNGARAIDQDLAREQIARSTRLPATEQERLLKEFLRWSRDHR